MFKRKQQPLIIPEYLSETFDDKLDWILKSNAAIQLTDQFALDDYADDLARYKAKKLAAGVSDE